MSVARRSVRRTGPLNPLRAFEVAARHMSFTVAADELCVTQGAISRAVKTLEDYFGVPLFKRLGNGLELTPKSRILAHKLTDIFSQLADATDEFQGSKASHVLTVWTYTSFMIGFLIPRLPDFQLRHPHIKVRLISATDSTDFNRDQVDVRLRYGHGHWHGFDSTLLFREELRPVCNPRLLGGRETMDVEELANQVLLHYDGRRHDWADWLSEAGHPDLSPRDNLVFDELSVANQAAIAGVGLAMVQKAYFQNEIAAGQLVAPFGTVLRRDRGYYLTVARERRNADHIAVFRDWLLEQLAAQADPEDYPVLRAANG
ncbi:MAG: transcriptional regulator GcvA [Novosphingobium sp.]|nr:transcriptional regulator GcvA [Novosphingobium sp.]